MDNFNKIINKVNVLWSIQQQKSKKADKLLADCEEIEGKMIGLLEDAQNADPAKYLLYLESFGERENNE